MANKTEYEVLLEMAAKLDPSYRTAMENARKSAKGVGEGAKESADDIGVMDIALGNLVANGISALIQAGANAARSIYGMAEETREFRQDMGTLETAFDDAGFTAETATETWKDLYAVFGEDDRAVEAANNISRMAKNQEDLNDWVEITTGVWGSYQDALPVESLAEAAGETAKVGKVTGTLADALNWNSEAAELFAGYMSKDVTTAEDAFNAALADCSTEAERQALIVDTLTKLYGGAADKYEETAASVMEANDAQADYLLTQAEMGERIEPITVAVKNGITDLMNAGLQLFANVDFAAWAGKIEGGFSWLINTGIPGMQSGFGWLKSNIPFVTAAVGTLTAAWLTFGGAQKIATAATNAFKFAQMALNVVMKANPIGLVITGIMLLVTAFIYLWNNCEGFRNFWIGLWGNIVSIAGSAKDVFLGIVDAISGGFTAMVNGVIVALNWMIDKVNSVSIGPLPDWSILGEYAGATIGFSIPNIPMLAEGGIAMSATPAIVGEGAEPEAILPLSKLDSLVSGSETISIVYSPNITVMPGANAEDVKTATAESFEQFKTYMDRYLRERKRLQFA